MSDRPLRDHLEQVEHERDALRTENDALKARVAALEAQLAMARTEQERLARELVHQAINPHGQTSNFSVEHVAALMEFLKGGA